MTIVTNIRIEYCVVWNYEPRALRARDLLVERYGIEVELVSGARASFEIIADGKTLYSKLATHRFPDDAEV